MAQNQSQIYGKDNPVHVLFVAAVIAAVLVFAGLLPNSDKGNAIDFGRFLAANYALLVFGMISIWAHGIPHGNDKSVDHEAIARDRFKATVAILIMVTLLGVATLITFAVVNPPKSVTPPAPENKEALAAICCRNVAVCGNPVMLTPCPCANAPSPLSANQATRQNEPSPPKKNP